MWHRGSFSDAATRVSLLCWLLTLLCVSVFLLGTQASAQTPPAPQSHAQLQLVAEETFFRPGRTLWAGVLFHLDSGWHIYWQNPGDSGEPPKIRWDLQSGFQAGAIRWPVPMRLGKGSVVDYGYEDEVLLMAPIRIVSPKVGSPVPIDAEVSYIVCREICIPGKARLSISLRRSKGRSRAPDFSEWRELFERTRAQFPKPMPSAWQVSVASKGNEFILSVRGAGAASAAAFFPLDPGVIENSAPQNLASSGNGFQLTLRKSEQPLKPVVSLRGLLVLGASGAFEISAPVAKQ